MAFPQGINFRLTSTFVTDVSPADYEIARTANYPRTTAQGNTVGWETADADYRDRASSNDPRLAGLAFSGFALTYRIDLLSAGNHLIRTAAGDANYTNTTQLSLRDGSTSLGALSSTNTTAANKFRDATDVEHTAANWPANNNPVTKTFATTICRFDLAAGACALAHIYIESASSPPATAGPALFRGRNFAFFDDDQVNRFEFWPAQAPSSDVTLALTGVSATSSAGSLTPSRSVALTGQSATSSIGTLSPSLSVSVTGNSATASAGSVTPSLSVGLTGSAGTTSIGTLAPNRTVSISGNSATSAVGTVTPIIGVTVALTGVSATTSVGTLGSSRTTALTGVSAPSSVGTVTPSIGVNVALTGVQATTSVGILSPSISRGLTGSSSTASVGTVIADRSVGIAGVTSTATVGSLGTTRTVSITGVEAVASVGTILPGTDDALAVSRNVGSAVLFTTHVGTGVLQTSDVGTMTVTTSNVGATSIVYQDVRTDT